MDPELAEKARRGDAQALERLLRALTPPLYRLAVRLAGDPHLAEEIVTEALYRGARRLRRLRNPAAAGAWFRRILLNLWRDTLRRRGRRELFLEEQPEPAASEASRPEAELEARETAAALQRELEALPPGQRAVMALAFFERLTVAEIAEALGTPADRVKANLWQARRRLRGRLPRILGTDLANGET